MSSNEPALMQIAERILKASQEKERAEEAIKMIYDEARSVGYEPKILRRAINILKMDESERKNIAQRKRFSACISGKWIFLNDRSQGRSMCHFTSAAANKRECYLAICARP